MNEIETKLTSEQLLQRRIKHLEGALEIAIGTFAMDERKGKHKQVFAWLKETLKGDVAPKVIEMPEPQDPKMLKSESQIK